MIKAEATEKEILLIVNKQAMQIFKVEKDDVTVQITSRSSIIIKQLGECCPFKFHVFPI